MREQRYMDLWGQSKNSDEFLTLTPGFFDA